MTESDLLVKARESLQALNDGFAWTWRQREAQRADIARALDRLAMLERDHFAIDAALADGEKEKTDA